VGAADGLETAGFCSTEGIEVAFANSAGQRLTGRTTSAQLDGIARTDTSDGSGRTASVRLADLDGTVVGAEAAQRAHDAAGATDLEPGTYEVVLSPSCVVNVLSFLAIYGFNGRAVEEGRSFVRLGESQFDSAISVADDVAHPMAVGVGFDAEGTPKSRVDLVQGGVTTSIVHDRRTAKALGSQSTGHAVPGAGAFGALPANLVLEPGGPSAEQLLAGVGRGLLVTDFWYTRVLDPRTIVVTGLTRNGVWLIEDGEIVRPVTNLRFTQSFVEALGPGRVEAVGGRARFADCEWGPGLVHTPALRLSAWRFTGGAAG
jgi:predicted Zn-dependent protease